MIDKQGHGGRGALVHVGELEAVCKFFGAQLALLLLAVQHLGIYFAAGDTGQEGHELVDNAAMAVNDAHHGPEIVIQQFDYRERGDKAPSLE